MKWVHTTYGWHLELGDVACSIEYECKAYWGYIYVEGDLVSRHRYDSLADAKAALEAQAKAYPHGQ